MQRLTKLWRDNRGIEGLPIRLVIALVVGVASLAIMTSILGGLPTFESTEVTVQVADGGQMTAENVKDEKTTLTLQAVDDSGDEVPEAQIIVKSGSASLEDDSAVVGNTAGSGSSGEDYEAKFDIYDEDASGVSASNNEVETDLREDQDVADLKVEIKPPSDSNYVDQQDDGQIITVTA